MSSFDYIAFATESDWIAERTKRVGCSDLPALFGCGYSGQTPLTVYRSKVDPGYEFKANKRMRAGVYLEPLACELFSELTGWHIDRPTMRWIVPHPRVRLAWSPDAIADIDGDHIPVEAKAVVDRETASIWRERVPDRVYIQLQGAMAVTGAEYGYGVAILGGDPDDFHYHKVDRSQAWIDAIESKVESFMDDVDLRIVPVVGAGDGENLRAMFPAATPGLSCDVPEELIERYESMKQVADDAVEKAESLKNAIIAIMGEAESGRAGDRVITYKTQSRKAYTVEASTFRVLRLGKKP